MDADPPTADDVSRTDDAPTLPAGHHVHMSRPLCHVLALTVASVGLCVAILCAGALAVERFRMADAGNHHCPLSQADVLRHGIAPESLESEWQWMPTGVACSYMSRTGEVIEFAPPPTWTIVLLAGITGAIAAPVGTAIGLARHRGHPEP